MSARRIYLSSIWSNKFWNSRKMAFLSRLVEEDKLSFFAKAAKNLPKKECINFSRDACGVLLYLSKKLKFSWKYSRKNSRQKSIFSVKEEPIIIDLGNKSSNCLVESQKKVFRIPFASRGCSWPSFTKINNFINSSGFKWHSENVITWAFKTPNKDSVNLFNIKTKNHTKIFVAIPLAHKIELKPLWNIWNFLGYMLKSIWCSRSIVLKFP